MVSRAMRGERYDWPSMIFRIAADLLSKVTVLERSQRIRYDGATDALFVGFRSPLRN